MVVQSVGEEQCWSLRVVRKLSIGMTETEAAETLFGIDILADNIEESIQRLTDLAPTAESIFRKNIVQGNFLKPEGIWFLEDAE